MTTAQLAPTAIVRFTVVKPLETSFIESSTDFSDLYTRYASDIKTYIARIFNNINQDDLDDIVQETFVTAMTRRVYPADPNKAQAWLRSIAKKVAVTIINQSKTQDRFFDQDYPEILGGRAMQKSLTTLQREALSMYNSGWNYRQIATHKNKTVKAIRSLIYRANQVLNQSQEREDAA